MKHIRLQAHRGVSTEFPENTMSAFRAAKIQGYDIIELDPAVTRDGFFVVHHDNVIGRTAREPDGSPARVKDKIENFTLQELLNMDFGGWFSAKFKGERIPRMEDVLSFAEKEKITLKLDNKIKRFDENTLESFLKMLKNSGAPLAFTANEINFVRRICRDFSDCEIHYDGAVDESTLVELKDLCGSRRLTVWLPMKNANTSWVKIPFVTKELSETVKEYAELGVWLLSDYEELELAAEIGADTVETTGTLKPGERYGFSADCHTHTNHSHDSACRLEDLISSAVAHGLDSVNVTDHCDVMTDPGAVERTEDSIRAVKSADAELSGGFHIRSGAEIGEPYSNPGMTERVLALPDCDVVIGSVHSVRGGSLDRVYYSKIDFSVMTENEIYSYLDGYFDDILAMLNCMPCDVMAHLTCPLRYINGKYRRGVDLQRYMPKITRILEFIIRHGIALEINTSGIGGALDDFMPDENIIRLYRQMGGYLLTFASDSHIASNVGNGFDKLRVLLKDIGFRDGFYFEKRFPVPYKL